LCAFLRHRAPIDNIHYSIFIFDLNDRDLHEAFEGAPAELVEPWTAK
jgi:hypothetical protein